MAVSERLTLLLEAQTTGTREVEKMVEALNRVSKAAEDAKKKGESSGSGFERFAESVKHAIENPLQAAGGAAEGFLKTLGPMGAGVTAAAGVLGVLGKVAYESVEHLGRLGDQINDISIRTGLTTKEVGQFSFAMKRAGGDISTIETAMRTLSRGLADTGDEGKAAREGLAALGIKARDADGNLRPMSQILIEISRGLGGIEDTARRNTVALSILGRSALDLLPDLLELEEGVRRARELGLGPSEEDVKRWESYHKQIAELESEWDRQVRKFKDKPLVATIIFSVKGLPAWLLKQLNDVEEQHQARMSESERLDKESAHGMMPPVPGREDDPYSKRKSENYLDIAGILGQRNRPPGAEAAQQYMSAVADNIASVGRGKNRIAGARSSWEGTSEGLQFKLQEARKEAAKLRDEFIALEGVTEEVAKQKEVAWRKSEAAAAGYQARLDAIKQSEQDQREISRLLGELHVAANMSEVEYLKETYRWYEKLSGVKMNAAQEQRAYADLSRIMAQETAKGTERLTKEWKNLTAEAAKWSATSSPSAKAWEDLFNNLETRAKAITSAVVEMGKTSSSGSFDKQRDAATRNANAAIRYGELTAAPGNEGTAIEASYRIRLGMAQQLFDIEKARIADQLRFIPEEIRKYKEAEMLVKARADMERETDEARIDRQMRYAELQRKHLDDYRAALGNVFDAMTAGGEGLRTLLTGQLRTIERTMFQNLGMEFYKTISGHLQLPGQGTADKPSLLGRLLMGTPFGIDPLKAAMDVNTTVTVDNSTAIRAFTAQLVAMSPSGGAVV